VSVDSTFYRRLPSPVATRGFGGLRPPNNVPSPPNWNTEMWDAIHRWNLSIFTMSRPLHKRKDPLLKIFWWWHWDYLS